MGGGTPWPGNGNILEAPDFASPAQEDYSLLADSPCIQAGRGGTDVGAVPFSSLPGSAFVRFDANESGKVDISDAIVTLRFLFQGSPEIPLPYPEEGTDPTGDALPCGP